MVVVADTSPLTALLHLGQSELLYHLYGQVVIPDSVATEVHTLTTFGYDVSFLRNETHYIISKATDRDFVRKLSEHLDAGEAEAIAIAKELAADLLLIDERLGKEAAEAINIPCKGVVGILIAAKHAGLIALVKPLLDEIISHLKFRLADNIYRLALQKAGELP